jgi:serine protease Do
MNAGASSLGSGFVIARGGGVSYMVTNNHVVSGARDLHVVMPNGGLFTATLVGADSLDDLAVVSVPSDSLPLATFGDSSALHVGEQVVAIGSPLGNQSSVTQGVISAKHRTISAGNGGASTETLEDVVQTDASINPGNSGGPLADVDARVVGVNVAVAGGANNIGYAIPSNVAREVATQLMEHQPVQHPFLGIGYLDSIDAVEAGRGFSGPGVLVTTVRDGTPAAQAGFQNGDILQAINGTAIDNGETLGGLIQDKHVGDKITCTVKRGSQMLTLTATLEERPANP